MNFERKYVFCVIALFNELCFYYDSKRIQCEAKQIEKYEYIARYLNIFYITLRNILEKLYYVIRLNIVFFSSKYTKICNKVLHHAII